ncbi:MAG: glutamine--fructose-6-phosphate transaminase (isomerizing) [Pseudomonadota bacterium]|nr:glutamine--fructose-6-phosphate transaminase (isomerizing) [Pseudomonadota bacterium]
MCGIFGYVGNSPCLEIIDNGLHKLEYRGYDSAGIMVFDREIQVAKTIGTVADLDSSSLSKQATVGIGHTRWASHGRPTLANAHPHVNADIAIVHNGIIDNHMQLRRELEGVEFKSDTDTEVVLHLLGRAIQTGLSPFAAFRKVCSRLEGMFALAVFFRTDAERLFLVRHGLSLALGEAKDATLFASDPVAFSSYSDSFRYLEDNHVAVLSGQGAQFYTLDGDLAEAPAAVKLRTTTASDDKGSYAHYMLKEIHQQGHILANTVYRLFDFSNLCPRYDLLGVDRLDCQRIKRIKVVGCGTSYHTALLTPYFVEDYLQIEASAEVAHELRYRKALLDEHTLMIAISQSGETADTITCVQHAKDRGCQTLVICNSSYSTLANMCDVFIDLQCGREVSVASTKTFTASVLVYYLLIAALRHRLGFEMPSELHNLRKLPLLIDYILANAEANDDQLTQVAKHYRTATNFLFLGRGPSYPVALEAALKLKEISYVHAEGGAGGELKHGTLALIDKHLPVLVLIPDDSYFSKSINCAGEVKAREGQVIALGSAQSHEIAAVSDYIIPCPTINHPILQTIVAAVSLQLFAYHIAVAKGRNIDQPRHLAKSVTVE